MCFFTWSWHHHVGLIKTMKCVGHSTNEVDAIFCLQPLINGGRIYVMYWTVKIGHICVIVITIIMFIFNIRLQIKFDTNKEYLIEEKENTLNYFADSADILAWSLYSATSLTDGIALRSWFPPNVHSWSYIRLI